MPRRPRLDAPGYLHHVLARGLERRAIFRDDTDRNDFLRRLSQLVASSATEVLAWALVPNHFHLLLRTTEVPLSDVMRCLLTGYAVRFNRRHKRSGYLFQNRFKSILVEQEPYLLELVRYIHLNPVRAHLLAGVEGLDDYPWTGHATLVGRVARPWQATAPVLALFARMESDAREAYQRFVLAGVNQDKRDDLMGGGLRRSRRGWLRLSEKIRGRDLWAFDERILGSSEFVQRVLESTNVDTRGRATWSLAQGSTLPAELLRQAAFLCGTSSHEIASPSRRRGAVAGRALVCAVAVLLLGMSHNAVARRLGLTRQSVRRGIERSDQVLAELGCELGNLLS
jgi:putative transposase